MHRIHAILDDQKKRHDDHSRKFKRISLLVFLISALLIAVAIWYAQLYISQLVKNTGVNEATTVNKVSINNPTSTATPTLYPTQDPKNCNESDQSFCRYLLTTQELVAQRNYPELLNQQVLRPFTCPDNPIYYYICENVAVGKTVYGYYKGLNDSEGGVFPKDKMLEAYGNHFNEKSPYHYHGYLVSGNRAVIVYLSDDQRSMHSFRLRKADSQWRIYEIIEGSSFDYRDLNPELFKYYNS